jgi:DNA ligase-1
VDIIAEYLTKLDDHSLPIAVLFLSGSIFPKGSSLTLNIGFKAVMQTISEIVQLKPSEVQRIYLRYGDIGALVEHAISKKQISPLIQRKLLLPNMYDQLRKIADATGSGSAEAKMKILMGLLINCSPLESKYLIKIVVGEMRTGAVDGLIELAIAKGFERELKDVRQAVLVSGNLGQVALLAKKNILSTATVKPLAPLSFMLADVLFSAEEISKYYNNATLVSEFKYDGIRVQLHKFGNQIRMFSRKLEDVTISFPEIAGAAAAATMMDKNFILDGEVLAYKTDRPLHFQELQKRLRRKNVTEQLMLEIPVIYVPYDILYFNDRSVIDKPLVERKRILSQIPFEKPIVEFGYRFVSTAEDISSTFEESKRIGHEGLVVKKPESLYYPGRRGRHWVKLKTELDTIDAVIVAAEYGHGKRAGTLSDYTFAVKDENPSNNDDILLKTIGKAYSGLTDREIDLMTQKLRAITIKDEGYVLHVKPEIVIEVAFDSIQKSARHNSGFALRFPRIKYIRSDKSMNDIDTMEKVQQIYEHQTHLISNR